MTYTCPHLSGTGECFTCRAERLGPCPRCGLWACSHVMDEAVDHPAHYNAHPSGVECITVVEHMTFNVGNAVKYLWRAGEKPGVDAIEDLRKAAWYVTREIERRSTASKKEEQSR